MLMNAFKQRTTYVAVVALVFALFLAAPLVSGDEALAQTTYTADVVLFDTGMMFNRLGAQNPNWMMFALRRDVVHADTLQPETAARPLQPGNVALRPDKRPRPLVLRIPADSNLTVNFQNLLTPVVFQPPVNPNNCPANDAQCLALLQNDNQVASQAASFHVAGLQVRTSVADDGTYVGQNAANGIAVNPGDFATYELYAESEGAFLVSSHGATFGGEASGGNIGVGAFGMVAVQPKGAKIYRSQVTEEELRLAADATKPEGIDYEALYPTGDANGNGVIDGLEVATVWDLEGKGGKPILNMMVGTAIFHSEINAIVAYKDPVTGAFKNFPLSTYPLESTGTRQNPSVPNRLEPFRDFASIWHDENAAVQAFPAFFDRMPNAQGVDQNPLAHALHGVRDSFMINYGSGGIGSEIIANRLGVGPMYDCLGCAYEEFFLTSFTVGDPAMIVDVPANVGLETCNPLVDPASCDPTAIGQKATEAFYPEDPANVHHSYTGDKVKLRNVHAGPKEQHIFHLHNHQWLFNANDDNANYLDAQGIGPGSSYTFEINYGGSGNRNKTAGDAIFHCHFYPHFAQGMWYHWRHHDVLETGTVLAVSAADDPQNPTTGFHTTQWGLRSGLPMAGARALPDGEIVAGTPIPAVVPIPGKPLPPVPGEVTVVAKDADGDGTPDSSQASVIDRTTNPGFPFWVAGIEDIVGQRPPTPQLDMLTKAEATALIDDPNSFFYQFRTGNDDYRDSFINAAGGFDGGLPRHALDGCKAIIGQLVTDGSLPAGTAATGCSILDPAIGAAALAGNPIFSTSVSKLDMHKEVLLSKAVFFPEEGTDVEKAAMGAHAQREHLDTSGKKFILNGGPPVPGAPYNEPCIDDTGQVFYSNVAGNFFDGDLSDTTWNPGSPAADRSATQPFVYKGANIQIDAVFNKVGYHYPQQRIISLWGDVNATIDKTKAPEPFVLRLNTFDCAQYYHTNLVPKEFEVDDYQVRTPTDIIGQHIHLPKWDLTTADGAANGWNYEDGTLSPGMVVERIEAINHGQGGIPDGNGGFTPLAAAYPADPDFPSNANHPEWMGARVTIQRWFADPVFNVAGHDRGLGIIFTHDHYGPSTFQQIGLYSTLLVEPAGSTWKHNETGVALGTRTDGGPTSWQAAIEPGVSNNGETVADFEPFREFYFEYSDFQHAYEAGVYVGAGPDGRPQAAHNADGVNATYPVTADSFRNAINPSYRQQAVGGPVLAVPVNDPAFPDIVRFPAVCPDGSPRPCPEAISADDPGMLVVNYRNEPVGLRVFNPLKPGPDGLNGTQADGRAGDLAFALQSRNDRAIAQLNTQPAAGDVAVPAIPIFNDLNDTNLPTTFPPPINSAGVGNSDPFTPMIRARDGDLVKFKVQTGATEHEHSMSIHGVKWLQGGSQNGQAPNSGWRNAQGGGISEQYTFVMPFISDNRQAGTTADYAYSVDVSQDGWWSGMWGILRSYRAPQTNLYDLSGGAAGIRIANLQNFDGVCPQFVLDDFGNPVDPPGRDRNIPLVPVQYDVAAVLANDVLSQSGFTAGALVIPDNQPDATTGLNNNEGGPIDPAGGTLVLNPRETAPNGPLHDPTAMMYVRLDDLQPRFTANSPDINGDIIDDRCQEPDGTVNIAAAGCPVELIADAPVEPLVLRANAGDCVEVTLHNKLIDQAADNLGNPVFTCEENLLAPDTCLAGTLQPLFDLQGAQDAQDQGLLLVQADGTPVLLADIVFDRVPDLAGYNTLLQMVIRNRQAQAQAGEPFSVTTFNNNLIRPSAHVGLHPQLVEYDVTRGDGTNVGINGTQTVPPGGRTTYQWYAGDLRPDYANVSGRGNNRRANLLATPVEFGGTNLIPADKVKQGQKGLIGALVIEPQGSTWPDALVDLTDTERDRQQADPAVTRKTRADVTVDCGGPKALTCPDGSFEDLVVMVQKGNNHRLGDGSAVPNIASEGQGIPEDSHDAGQKGVNYGTEPAWFRFGLAADAPFGRGPGQLGSPTDAWMLYHNSQAANEDPATPVYEVPVNAEARLRVLEPTGVGRGTTFTVHGHIWQRDPYLCPDDIADGIPGKCANVDMATFRQVGSLSIGKNPIGFYLGGQESVQPYEHFDLRLENTGGVNGIDGDYLWRDQASFGNTDGIWGLMRVVGP